MKQDQIRGLFWLLCIVFFAVAMVAEQLLLPRNHWSSTLLTVLVPVLMAQLVTTLVLRSRGEARDLVEWQQWPNNRYNGMPFLAELRCELHHPRWQKWVFPALGASVVLALSHVYFFVPPSQIIGRELAPPLIFFLAIGTVFLIYSSSSPLVRVDERGIGGVFSRTQGWNEIAMCRIEEKRNSMGEVAHIRLELLGVHGQVLTILSLAEASEQNRARFLERLPLALEQA